MVERREQLLEIMEDAARGETKATLRDRIAELEAKNERLRTLVMAQSRAIHSPEALSRTGAVKVGYANSTAPGNPFVTPAAPSPTAGVDEDQRIAKALDAYRFYIDASEEELKERGIDRDRALAIAREIDPYDGANPTALTRPTERTVTEAMVEAVVQAVRPYTMQTLFIDEHRELVRDALKAAQEGK